MALNKNGIDHKAIARDQGAIDKLPNHGRASVNHAKSSALKKKIDKKDYINIAKGGDLPAFYKK